MSGAARPPVDHPSRFLRFFKVGDTQATQLVAKGSGEDLLRLPNRSFPSFVSAATFLGRAAQKVGQYAARKVGHLRAVHSTCFSPDTKRNRLVGMWASRVVCEMSKRLWASFCDVHRRVISTAASSSVMVLTSFVGG